MKNLIIIWVGLLMVFNLAVWNRGGNELEFEDKVITQDDIPKKSAIKVPISDTYFFEKHDDDSFYRRYNLIKSKQIKSWVPFIYNGTEIDISKQGYIEKIGGSSSSSN